MISNCSEGITGWIGSLIDLTGVVEVRLDGGVC